VTGCQAHKKIFTGATEIVEHIGITGTISTKFSEIDITPC